jgi:hypothetical protein
VRRRSLLNGSALLSLAALAACAHALGASTHHPLQRLTNRARDAAIRRAQVWRATNIAALDIRKGPDDKRGFPSGATVPCLFVTHKSSGHSPKFTCEVAPGDEVKVKYGQRNGEVYGEVAATRLLWALGFGADRVYPVRVECHDCPPDPARDPNQPRQRVVMFDPAAIERKMPGEEMGTAPDSGWSWPELDLVAESAGGAPRAHRDALKLLAVMIQHTDSKPSQQRLVCLNPHLEDGQCAEPFMMINDLGLTFGHATAMNSNAEASVNFERWARTHVWKETAQCVGNIDRSVTGTLDRPIISEGGRAFLADLLRQLTDAQLHDLFEVARFPLRSQGVEPRKPMITTDQWVAAFKQKRSEIAGRSCGA